LKNKNYFGPKFVFLYYIVFSYLYFLRTYQTTFVHYENALDCNRKSLCWRYEDGSKDAYEPKYQLVIPRVMLT